MSSHYSDFYTGQYNTIVLVGLSEGLHMYSYRFNTSVEKVHQLRELLDQVAKFI